MIHGWLRFAIEHFWPLELLDYLTLSLVTQNFLSLTNNVKMNTDQSKCRQLLLSPSLSTVSTPSSTQAPSLIKTILLGHGISDERADELNSRYNRRSILIMDDELFMS